MIADVRISWSLLLQLAGPCWLLLYLASIVIYDYALPRSWRDALRIFAEDSVRLEHLDTEPIYRKPVKWKVIAFCLLSGFRLAQQIISIILLHLTASDHHENVLVWPLYCVAVVWVDLRSIPPRFILNFPADPSHNARIHAALHNTKIQCAIVLYPRCVKPALPGGLR